MASNVTFKDVARLAGVSTQTVSRVTNGAQNVNEETRKRVQAAIEELGYIPNKSAQQLGRKRVKTFGVLTLDLSLQGASRIVEGIRNESSKAGYAISLIVADENNAPLDDGIRELKSQQVDAIFINYPVTKEDAERIIHENDSLPFVFIDTDPEAQVNLVMADHYAGAEEAANLMLQHDRKNFAFINGPEHSPAAQIRRKAWRSVIENAGVDIIAEENGDWSARSGYANAVKLFSRGETIDAIMVANDQMALGVLRACREYRFDVPKKIAVIGFDDTDNSEFFSPPLTTVCQDFLEIGHQAVEEIISSLTDTGVCEPINRTVSVKLIERQSTSMFQLVSNENDRLTALLSELKELLP